ncbi:nucleoside diphosphate kinase A 1-like [Amyelois transitella]|uniref:nucleoside diphosphate kinase A 1-like n=1 Tax=Amyelois transitella TaxID=680683 RepID=UPI00298FFFA7|nr:nucleoside diphosphate kinase A 1-like [Amyelois transitella]
MEAKPRERTFIMVKPDGVQRGLIGPIITRFENRGFKMVALKLMSPKKDMLLEHYEDLKDRPFFSELVTYMHSGPVVPMVWEGEDVVKISRQMLGATNPADSKPGTIRGDFSIDISRNVIHGSDSVEAADKEISIWFAEQEIVNWRSIDEDWIYE